MAKYLVCEGTLSQARAGPTNVTNVLACDSGWVVKEEVVTAGANSVLDIVFVVALFIAFCAGFHKGGQR